MRIVTRVAGVAKLVLFMVALTGVFLYTRAGAPTRVEAATSSNLNFQARLLTQSGAIAGDGNYDVEFRLYNQASGGTALWTETRTGANQVQVRSGYLSVYLGSVTPLPNINWDQDLWLTMNVNSDGEMNPRIKLTAVPYAFQARSASQMEVLQGTNTGNLQFDTLTGNRNILLPDASGTVCLQNSSACGFATGNGAAFLQGGNSFGGAATLGTNDNFNLNFETNGTTRLTLDTSGNLSLLGGNLSVTGSGTFTGNMQVDGNTTLGNAAGDTLTITGTAVATPNGLNFDGGTLVIDATNDRVGIGTASPARRLEVLDLTNPQLRLSHTAGSVYADLRVDANGYLSISPTGNRINWGGSAYILTTGQHNFRTVFRADPSNFFSVENSSGTEFLRVNNSGDLIQSGSGTFSTGTGAVSLNGATTVASTLTVQGTTATIGTATQAGALILNDGAGATARIETATLGQNTTYVLQDPGLATVNICLSSGNCAGQNGAIGTVQGGTANRLAKFTASFTVEDSSILDDGTNVTLDNNVNLVLQGSGNIVLEDATTGFTATLAVNANTLSANQIIYLPNEGGTICTTSGNCIGSGGAGDIFNGGQLGPVAIGTDDETNLTFETNDTTRMTITGSGNVGIGLSSTPSALLSVGGVNGNFRVDNSGNTVVGGNLSVTGTSTFTGAATFNSSVTVAAQQTIRLVGGTTAQRPASPAEGMLYFDTDTKQLLTYANGKWQGDRSTATKIVAASNSSQTAKDAADYVADGTADQTEINAALTAAAGGTVYLMPGEYVVSAPILVPSATTLSGSREGSVITIPDAHNASINIITNSDTTNGNDRITIKDLTIDGNRANQASGSVNGIVFDKVGAALVNGADVTSVNFRNISGTAVDTNNSFNVLIEKSVVTNTNYGFWINTSRQITIHANKILDPGVGSLGAFNTPYSGHHQITITNNTLTGNGSDVSIQGGGLVFANNNMSGSGSLELYFEGAGNTITGNTLKGGRLTTDGNEQTITGNSFSESATSGLVIYDAYNSVISSNIVFDNAHHGIDAESVSSLFTGNNVHNNGGSGSYSGIVVSYGNNNIITNNRITDTAGTGYAIEILNGIANTYLEGNTYSGTGASSINDQGTGTIYGGQLAGNDFIIQPAGNIELIANTNVTGDLTVTGLTTTNSLDVVANATIGGTLEVTGLATLLNNLDVQGGSITVGTATQAGGLYIYDGSSNTGLIQTAALGQNTTYILEDPGQASVNICLSTGNCAGAGGGVTTSGGTTNRIAVFTGGSSIGDSVLLQGTGTLTIDSGTDLILAGGNLDITGAGSFSGNLSVGGTLAVTGTSTFTGGASFNGGISIGNDSNFVQTGTGTFSTGTGTVSLNGATSVTGSNDFTVGTGATSLGGTLTVAGVSTFNGNVEIASTNTLTVGTGATTLGGTLSVGGVVTLTTLGAADTDNVLCRNTGNEIAGCNSTFATTDNAFLQGGNSFGATAVLGTNDANDLQLRTNGTTRVTVNATTGNVSFAGSVEVAAQQTIRLVGGTTAQRPASPAEGMLYFDTDTKQLLTYANGKWQGDRSTATKIVAASNSPQAVRDSADYVAGATNSQTAINAALTAAAGGKVYLAEGTYVINASISIPNNTTLVGAGRGTLIELADLDSNINAIVNADTTTGTGVTIQDLRLDGRKDLNTAGTQFGIIGDGLGSGSGSTARVGLKATGLWIENFRTTGIYLYQSSNSTISNNTFKSNGGATGSQSGSHNTFTNNIAIDSGGSAFYNYDTSFNTYAGNTAQGQQYGIVFDISPNNVVSGNTFRDSSIYGISMNNSSDSNTITGNGVHNSGSSTDNNGIRVNNSDDNLITGNNITDSSCTTTCYAITIQSSTAERTYLADNYYVSPATINDTGTGTIYGGQLSGGDFVIQPAGNIELISNTNVTGDLAVDGNISTTGNLTVTGNASVTGTLTVGTLGTADTDAVLCLNSTNQLAACQSTFVTTDDLNVSDVFLQGGNSFGATAVLGTQDNFSLSFKTNDVVRMTLDTSGNLGLGIAVPEFKLHVVNEGASFISNDAYGNVAVFQGRRANGTVASPTALLEGNTITQFSGRGHDGTAFTGTRGAVIIQASEDWTSTAQGTDIKFLTTENGTNVLGPVRLTISNEGYVHAHTALRVGNVGTTSYQFTVGGTGNQMAIVSYNPADISEGRFINDLNNYFGIGINGSGAGDANAAFLWQYSNNDIRFGTNNTERMRIYGNGNLAVDTNTFFVDAVNNRVGIGTINPASLVDVRNNSDSGASSIRIGGGTSASSTALSSIQLREHSSGAFDFGADLVYDNNSNLFHLQGVNGGVATNHLTMGRDSGNFAIGTTDVTSARLRVEATNTSTSSSTQRGILSMLHVNPGSNQASGATSLGISGNVWVQGTATKHNVTGIYADAYNSGTGNLNQLWGMHSIAYSDTAATVSSLLGAHAHGQITGGGTSSLVAGLQTYSRAGGSTNVTDLVGIHISDVATSSSANVTNRYGLKIDAPTTGASPTNDYGIWQGGSGQLNYFAGQLQLNNLAAADADSYALCRDASTGRISACDSTNTTGRPILQGGNSFGATMLVGTIDAQALHFKTNDLVRMTLDANGNFAVDTDTFFVDAVNNRVGIGTTTPNGRLSLAGTGQTNGIYLNNSDLTSIWIDAGGDLNIDSLVNDLNLRAADDIDFFTAGQLRMSINELGNVGIGIANPQANFIVHGDAGTNPRMRLSYGGITTPNFTASSSIGDVANTNTVGQFRNNLGGNGLNTSGGLLVQGFTGAGVNDWNPLHFIGTHGGTSPTSAAVTISGQKFNGVDNRTGLTGNEIILDVTANGYDDTVLRVLGNGNVGIGLGTTTPTDKLHVINDISGRGITIDRNSATDRKSQLTFMQQGAWRYSLGIDYSGNNTNNFFIYDEVAEASRLIIDQNGRIGIGASNTNPQALLDLLYGGGAEDVFRVSTGATERFALTVNSSGDDYAAFKVRGSTVLGMNEFGQVGIGTTAINPTGLFDVNQNDSIRFQVGLNYTTDVYNLGFATDQGDRNIRLISNEGTRRQVMMFGDSNATNNYFGLGASNDGGATWDPHFTVRQDGRIGIGTASPTQLIHALKASDYMSAMLQNTRSTEAYTSFIAQNNLGGMAELGIGSSGAPSSTYSNRAYLYSNSTAAGLSVVSASATGDIRFFTAGDGSSNRRLSINSVGNVAIGSHDAQAKLHVLENGTAFTPGTGTVAVFQRSSSTTANVGISLISGSMSTNNNISFGNTSNEFQGGFRYNHEFNLLHVRANNSNVFTIDGVNRSHYFSNAGSHSLFIEGRNDGNGRSFTLQAGSVLSSATAHTGGNLNLQGGNAAASSGGANGGDVLLFGGTGAGTGADGNVLAAWTGSAARGMLKVGTNATPNLVGARLLTTHAEITTALFVGNASNYITNSGAGGQLRFFGTARNTRKITLVPEYAGGTLWADGTNNVGTMTSDWDSTARRNYYQWSTSQTGTQQNYDVLVTFAVPSDWSAWASSNSFTLFTRTSNVTNSSGATVTVIGTNGSTDINASTINPGSANTWTAFNFNLNNANYVKDGMVTIRIKMSALSNSTFQAGEIVLTYLSEF